MGDLKYMDKALFESFIEKIPFVLKPQKMSIYQIQLMFKVLYSGAMRINEVLQITPNDVMPNKRIRLRYTKTGWKNCDCSIWKYYPKRLDKVDLNCSKCHGQGKVRTIQYAWITDQVYNELQEFVKDLPKDMRIFPISDRMALNYANEVMGARTHTFRHSRLTEMINTGQIQPDMVRQKARHTNLQVTSEYIQSNPDLAQKRENEIMRD